ncbi:MAG: hypothetical protein CME71_00330 [Halobacteriovorax sp.]|nr:hypothetical protein [Halobacteriovorax sp.]|tara:strand:+ start:87 stop:332 length:246 start_codon:yes stop_codon:yes gene_type:complete
MEKSKQKRDRRELKSRSLRSINRSKRTIDATTYTWKTEPEVARVVHGIPNQLDSIKALGNAVVPNQARLAFEILTGLRKPL